MLRELRVRNWKAFEDRTIPFGPGLNLFVGPNGSGKTTILDAVCLALTGGIPSGDFKSLVRDNQQVAAIELDWSSADVNYSVKRRFARERVISAELVRDNNRAAQLSWDLLSSRLARELKTDPIFFSRMVYMSEVEVFEYAKDPPARALNSALERVLGIDVLTALADLTERLNRTYAKSATGLRQELMRTAQQASEPMLDPNAARRELERTNNELEEVRKDIDRIRGEAQRLQLVSSDLAKAKNVLNDFKKMCSELSVDPGTSLSTFGDIQNVVLAVTRKIEQLDDQVRQDTSDKGSIESTGRYLNNIRDLLSAVLQQGSEVGPPCPVCGRPIDKELAARLTEETETKILLNRETLAKLDEKLKVGRNQLQKHRTSAKRLETLLTQLMDVSMSAKNRGFVFEASEVDELFRKVDIQVQETEGELRRLEARFAELAQRVPAEAAMLGRIEGRAGLSTIREDLRNQVVQAYKGSILTETLMKALRDLVVDQRDEGIKPLYLALAELWKRWRPDHEWTVTFDKEGRIELRFKNTNLRFSQLSGGEKTVLLILSRVLMLGLLSEMDFLMIDKPLEHLDLRNRRAVLNFLVASNRCALVRQSVVTTFEESLVRKYLDGDKTNTVYLSRSVV